MVGCEQLLLEGLVLLSIQRPRQRTGVGSLPKPTPTVSRTADIRCTTYPTKRARGQAIHANNTVPNIGSMSVDNFLSVPSELSNKEGPLMPTRKKY